MIAEAKGELLARGDGRCQHDIDGIVTARIAFLRGHAFVLEERKCVAAGVFDGVGAEGARQLESHVANGGGLRAKTNGGSGLQGNVGEDGGIDGVSQSAKRSGRRGKACGSIGGPGIEV